MMPTTWGFVIQPFCLLVILWRTCQAFQPVAKTQRLGRPSVVCSVSRRDMFDSLLLPSILAILLPTKPSLASEVQDLTSQLFNPDGSLKEGVESEIKFRKVEFSWDPSDDLSMNQDGVNVGDTKKGSKLRLSYEYPLRWSDGKDGDPIYFDRSEGTNAKACKRITVYQSSGFADEKRLEKATTIGVAKALDAPESVLSRMYKADIISGRIVERGSNKYYEFDMAAAPDSCGNSKENLGLGFCPYDNIFLLSATVVNELLYCIVVECDDTKIWKLASAELKRVRSSFVVEATA
ncbi:hypothetical protein IV203_034852 [Nitzschia inconspicua]|uniref:PsbP C-terminal domain-containing protein n=1 Tax=Nitzschia inconspicua TaxID=303405 RepID=A0A9K3LDL5_9STRA|nr:hypothetical protein IV203_034852 [Nitzschia inconspicua]